VPWPEDPKADSKTGPSNFVSDLYLRIESVRTEDGQGRGCTDTAILNESARPLLGLYSRLLDGLLP
jgi:hypothetical protein